MFGNGLHLPVTPEIVVDVLQRLRTDDKPAHEDVFRVDWAGIRTRITMLPWAPQELAGTTTDRLPVPTDGYRSEAEEYVALGLSLHNERDTYRIVEVGAGWAPWAVMGLKLAHRRNKRAIGIAVEADDLRAGWAVQHGHDNDIAVERIAGSSADIRTRLPDSDASLRVVQAACWTEETTLKFPVLTDDDMGGAVSTDPDAHMDYRGAFFDHVEVPTVTLETLLAGDDATDLLHIDLQGRELDVILPNLELIEHKVRFLAVGTHNRYVEGVLQETLLQREWALLLESPCTTVLDGVKPSLTGFTVQDGNQLYANSRYRDADPIIIRTRTETD
jgi:FkbM family methyltransferase